MMRWSFLLLIVLATLGVSSRARATEREIQVTLDAATGDEPTQLCVVAAFIKAAGVDPFPAPSSPPLAPLAPACQWGATKMGECKAYDHTVHQQLEANGACARDLTFRQPTPGLRVWCSPEPTAGPKRLLALKVDAGVTQTPAFGGSLVRLTVDTPAPTKGSVAVDIVGGDYRKSGVASHRERDDTDRARLSLTPRCVSSRVVIPRYECPDDAAGAKPSSPLIELLDRPGHTLYAAAFELLSDAVDLPLPDLERAGGVLRLSACGPGRSLKLEADWPDQPPASLTLKPKVFSFRWQVDPIAIGTCPRHVTLPEVRLQCDALARKPVQDLCTYQCAASIPIDLPTRVEFQERVGCQDPNCAKYISLNRWDAVLIRPGTTLDGYLPRDQRFIVLDRTSWDHERSDRAGDHIDSIWIATPDGKGQFVTPATPRLFVPGVQKGDTITYKYIGSRLFKEQSAAVGRGGRVELNDPDISYARAVQPGLAIWGGWRFLKGAEDVTRWDPAGGVEFILALPGCRLQWQTFYIEPAFHVGATITTQSYESIFQETSSGQPKDVSHNVRIFVLPVELTFRSPIIGDDLQIDLGLGLTWYQQLYAKDSNRVAENIGLTFPRATLLWHVTRPISLGFDSRFTWGQVGVFRSRRVIETFDLGGREQREERNAMMITLGPILRFDDVF